MNEVRNNFFIKPTQGTSCTINPKPINYRFRSEGGYGDRWMKNSRTPAVKAMVVSETSNTDFNSAKSRSALQTGGSSRRSEGRAHGSGFPRTTSTKSPRTPISATLSAAGHDSKYIVAITEGRGKSRGEVGIAAIDVYRPNLIVSQISDCQTYTKSLAKISIFSPVEIILPSTLCDGTSNAKLFNCIKEQYPNITITTVQRRHFSDSRGLELIKSLCVPEYSSVEVLVQNRFYALSATAALLKYVEFLQNLIFAPKSLSINYQGSQNTMLIDTETAKRLEIVSSAKTDSGFQHLSLLGTLNHTYTIGGYRLLRATLLQPPCILKDVETRLECVEELVNNPTSFRAFQAVLPKFADVERLLTLSMMAPTTGDKSERSVEYQLNYVLLLKSCLENLGGLRESVSNCQHPFFLSIFEMLNAEGLEKIYERVKDLLHEDAKSVKGYSASSIQRCFAIKSEMHVLLDLARKTYCDLVDEITQLVQSYSEESGLPLRVGHNTMKGFHIQMSVGGPNAKLRNTQLPKTFIQVNITRSTISMTTQAMVNLDSRSKEMLREIQSMSAMVLSEILSEVRQQAGCLYQLCEAVSQIDVITSLATISCLPDHVKPIFGNKYSIKAGKHPILANICQREPAPNDIEASEEKNFHIVTGPNMAGKSIYIRQVALLQILAQIGCYVPAESAEFPLMDRIFTRIGFEDSIEGNASTFVVEMKEMNFILQQMTPNSLIIIDELCRGTSSEEGTSIAWALCERLLCSPAITFFTTHFLYLTRLQNIYSNVTNLCLEAVETAATHFQNNLEITDEDSEEKWIRYTHRLIPGVMKIEKYGLRLAKLSLMPKEVTISADIILAQLVAARKPLPDMKLGGQAVMLYQTFRCMLKSIAEKYRDDAKTAFVNHQLTVRKFKEQHPNWQEEINMRGTPLPTPQHLRSESARINSVSPFIRDIQLHANGTSLMTPRPIQGRILGGTHQNKDFFTPSRPPPQTPSRPLSESSQNSNLSTPFSISQIPMPNFKTRRIEEYFVKVSRTSPSEEERTEEVELCSEVQPEELMTVDQVVEATEGESLHSADQATPEPSQKLDIPVEPVLEKLSTSEALPKSTPALTIQELLKQALPSFNFDVSAPENNGKSTVTSYSFGSASFTVPTAVKRSQVVQPQTEEILIHEDVEEQMETNQDLIYKCVDVDEIFRTPTIRQRFQLPSPEFSHSISFKSFKEQRLRRNQAAMKRLAKPAIVHDAPPESPNFMRLYKDFTPSPQQIETAQKALERKLERMRSTSDNS